MDYGVLYASRTVGKGRYAVSGGLEIDESEPFNTTRVRDTRESE
jgi:hypothetical protein